MYLIFSLWMSAFSYSNHWTCSLDANLSGSVYAVVAGYKSIRGPGTLTCKSREGRFSKTDLKLEFGGYVLGGLGYANITNLKISAPNFHLSSPKLIFGQYKSAFRVEGSFSGNSAGNDNISLRFIKKVNRWIDRIEFKGYLSEYKSSKYSLFGGHAFNELKISKK